MPTTPARPSPVPGWADPNQASVFDAPLTSVIRAIVNAGQKVGSLTGMDQPQNQLLAVMNPMEVGPSGGLTGLIQKVIKAYHGSPHDFERFSLDKIGTGEGAQAYGHGLYFAENPEVAKSYADDLGFARRAKEPASAAGVTYPPGTDRHRALLDVVDVGKEKALARLDADIRFNESYAPERAALQRGTREWLAGLSPSEISAATKGKTYEVNIHASPDQLLDWDKPLSQQSPQVQQALRKIDPERMDMTQNQSFDITARKFYDDLAEQADAKRRGSMPYVARKAAASEKLRKAGIPGVKYLDGGSRSAGEGTRNYVIWDDKLITILRKYGVALPAIEALRQEAMKNGGQIDAERVQQVMP